MDVKTGRVTARAAKLKYRETLGESRHFSLYAQRIDQHLANGIQLAQYVIGNGLIGRRVTDRCAPALRQREV
jgi:hypothetical protein